LSQQLEGYGASIHLRTARGGPFSDWSGEIMKIRRRLAVSTACGLNLLLAACGGGGTTQTTPPVNPTTYLLTVASTNPASGVAITVTPSDKNNAGNGVTSFTRTYDAGTTVTLTAPSAAGSNNFSAWSGCTSSSTVTCTVVLNADTTVTASYTTPAGPVTYYVSGTGSDSADGLSAASAFLTLQHAADQTQPGDSVYVMNGTYTNSCASCDVLAISTPGTANNWITYQAYPGQNPLISFNGWAGIYFASTAAYIEVNGFSIQGNNYNVTLQEAQNQSTSNPDPAFNGNGISADGRAGTATQRPNHLRILNNVIWACGGAGVGTAWSDYVTISGNTIYDSAWYSIYGGSGISNWENWNADSSTAYKMVITANRLFGNEQRVPTAGTGVILDGEAIIIDSTRNSAYNPANDSLPPYTGRTLIANNVIYANGSSAVEVFESDHVDVVNNSSYQDVTNPPLTGRGEMDLNQTSDDNVINNIFYSATGQNPVAVVPGTTSAILLDYNLYYNGNNFGDVANGSHDLSADPAYVDPTAANRDSVLLSVEPSSPAVGSGTSDLAPATDFAGSPRPGSKGYDRGAYQQQ
jgi:hypothetical protein